MERALATLVTQERFDVIHFCTTILGYNDVPKGIPLVGDMHNIEYDNVRRWHENTKNPILKSYFRHEYLRLKEDETRITDKFDIVITTTERDKELIQEQLPKKPIFAIPNGVAQSFFQETKVKEEPLSMVFAGILHYLPNANGITWFMDEILPLILKKEPRAKLYVVGPNPPKLIRRRADKNIIVTGFVDDVREYFARGQVFIIPLLMGGGIRNKALEAMAMRRPIVTTTIGCEGIDLEHEKSALFADVPEQFANHVVRMFADARLRERLANAAFANVVEGYNWERNGEKLDQLYRSLVDRNGKPIMDDREVANSMRIPMS